MVKRHHSIFSWLCLVIALSVPLAASGGNSFLDSPASTSGLINATAEFLPVERAYQLIPSIDGQELVLDWNIAPGYYLYKHRFAIRSTRPKAAVAQTSSLIFQAGQFIYDDYYEKDLEVFYTTTQVRAKLTDLDAVADAPAFTLTISSQGCADAGLCYPPRTEYLSVNTDDGSVRLIDPAALDSTGTSESTATSETSLDRNESLTQGYSMAIILLFALFGGAILNLMPCVFPVLSIKVMSTTAAHFGDHNKHVHSLAYSAGIILSFMAIAALMIGLRESGRAIGWGFQLQSPTFVALLAYLLFVIAQSFSGQLSIGGSWMNIGQGFTQSNRVSASFMTGVLATVVASPCTAPFMGTALGVALTQPAGLSMAIFAALGLGMALPFLVLSWTPGLMEKLPAPGPWMKTFSQLLAFPLYASVIWLLWVLGRQTSIDHAIVVSLGILLLAFAIWVYGHSKTIFAKGVLVISLAGALGLGLSRESTEQQALWQPYTPAALSELRREGKAVFINLTADWCITCLANEKIALSSDAFEATLKTRDIAYLKGDWTNNNPSITRLLNEHGRSGVPLYLYYDAAGGPASVLPQLLSENIVLKALGAL